MHLVVSFAAPLSEAGRDAISRLALPGLAALLAGRSAERDDGDEWSLTPPHERALAREFGWAGGDGRLPFAALHAAADGIEPGELCWGELLPVHWHLGTDQVSMADPATLALADDESHVLFDAVRELFVSMGFVMRRGAAGRWYLAHEGLAEVAAASPDRVAGRNVDPWLAAGTLPPLVRRLLNEAQMLLHTHPLNAAREARAALPVNALWLWGCGAFQPARGDARLEPRLRAGAVAEDWPAWAQAWTAIDADWAGPAAQAGRDAALPGRLAKLTLAGERAAATYALPARGWLQRLLAGRADLRPLLRSL